jgi:SMC interacting uncharacterized protein involved in chromosome segregation
METRLITKTIKELADEFDGNVEQLHRTIASRDAQILRLQEDNEALNYHIEFQKLEREGAEEKSATSLLVMILYSISLSIFLALKMLLTW